MPRHLKKILRGEKPMWIIKAIVAMTALAALFYGAERIAKHYYNLGHKNGQKFQRQKDKDQLEKSDEIVLEAEEALRLTEEERNLALTERDKAIRALERAKQEKERYRDRMNTILRKIAKELGGNQPNLISIKNRLKNLAHNLFSPTVKDAEKTEE